MVVVARVVVGRVIEVCSERGEQGGCRARHCGVSLATATSPPSTLLHMPARLHALLLGRRPPPAPAHPPARLQGDNNWGDDRSLYPRGQLWLNMEHLMGTVVG